MANYDVLVIGSGLSGLITALKAADLGYKVCVLSKEKELWEANTYYAQGGIVGPAEEDTPGMLFQDILEAGSRINYTKAVDLIAQEGPQAVGEFLISRIKVPFYTNANGNYDKTKEAAHSVRRILHVKDETGKAIETSFLDYIKDNPNIHCLADHTAIDIITNTHNSLDYQQQYKPTRAIGAYVLNNQSGEVGAFFAPAVVLATGGVGNLFLHTSNPKGATGDGIATAYRVGAPVMNSEFVQFHPTTLYHRDVNRFLITEALRGEGARLMNKKGEYFMERYHPELRDLAPRDQVARAIYEEMESESGYVFLDARTCQVSVKERFPSIYAKCLGVGVDMERDPIPVVPAAHYFCGGVKVDLEGRSSIRGLYAVGESACTGVHGANRLASVSLLEALYFGLRAALALDRDFEKTHKALLRSVPEWVYPQQEEEFDPVLIHHDLANIQVTMWNYTGIIRTEKRLFRALSDLGYMSHRIEQFYKQAKVTRELIELRNAVQTASLITRAAVRNKHSLGCHYLR